jgi:putative peptide zinc metalloprotease protein
VAVPPETATKEQATQAEQNGPPRLADGIELIGVYEGSGFKDPPHIVRRADGQVVQLPELLFVVAEECADGSSSSGEVAVRVAARL